jgi:hypothetical protein
MNAREYEYYLAKKVSRFFGPRYIREDFFLGPNLVSFNQTVKGDPKSRTLSCTSNTTETRNPYVIKVILLACFTYIDIF